MCIYRMSVHGFNSALRDYFSPSLGLLPFPPLFWGKREKKKKKSHEKIEFLRLSHYKQEPTWVHVPQVEILQTFWAIKVGGVGGDLNSSSQIKSYHTYHMESSCREFMLVMELGKEGGAQSSNSCLYWCCILLLYTEWTYAQSWGQQFKGLPPRNTGWARARIMWHKRRKHNPLITKMALK